MARKQSLKQQQAKWYKILEDEGFKDIETSTGALKVNETDRINRNTFTRLPEGPTSIKKPTVLSTGTGPVNKAERYKTASIVHQAKQDYYYYAEHFLNEYEFESEVDKKIWECHAKGMSAEDTFQVLATMSIRSNKQIDNTISKLIKEMKKAKGIK